MSETLTARWADERRAEIIVEEGGVRRIVPADLANADYRRLVQGDRETGEGSVEIGAQGA
jgi:hypothetical protein